MPASLRTVATLAALALIDPRPGRRPPPTEDAASCGSSSSAPTPTTASSTPAGRPPAGPSSGTRSSSSASPTATSATTRWPAPSWPAGGPPRSSGAPRSSASTTEVLDNHDGELLPTLENRKAIVRLIREWKADLVIAPRPNDYHPDHRYTGVLVQDAAFMVIVPSFCPDVPALRKNPVFLYTEDDFKKPNPFAPDVVVPIDPALEQKVACIDALESQFYEWNPWLFGYLDEVPTGKAERLDWTRKRTAMRYGADRRPLPGEAGRAARRGAGQGGESRRGVRGLRVRHAADQGGPPAALPLLWPGVRGPGTSVPRLLVHDVQ